MAAERRFPGWAFVVAFLLVGVVVGVSLVLLRPTPREGPPVLLILAEGSISASPANAALNADFGPHCSPWQWDDEEARLTVQADAVVDDAVGLLLQRFATGTPNFLSNGGDFLRPGVHRNGTVWRLTSPIDGRELLTLNPSGENVSVGADAYAPGDSWTMQFVYDVDTPDGPVQITEGIVFRNVGIVSPRIVPAAGCL